jgi:hypothetical protein
MSNSPLVTPVAEIKQKLQTLLEAGHVDEYFVEDIWSLLHPKPPVDNIIAGVDFSDSLKILDSL